MKKLFGRAKETAQNQERCDESGYGWDEVSCAEGEEVYEDEYEEDYIEGLKGEMDSEDGTYEDPYDDMAGLSPQKRLPMMHTRNRESVKPENWRRKSTRPKKQRRNIGLRSLRQKKGRKPVRKRPLVCTKVPWWGGLQQR